MTTSKIHCDFFEIYNIDWANLSPHKVSQLIEIIENMELLGTAPHLFGFVSTKRLGDVIGGFFAIQYEDSRIYYARDKQYKIEQDEPYERILFVLFARTGKLLLQNRKLGSSNLKMPAIRDRFKEALNQAFSRAQIGFTLGFYPPTTIIDKERFAEEFALSTRVINLIVENPDPNKIPEGFVYYNPQRERNEIIALSHKNDYSNYKKIDLEATSTGNIKNTHMGKDLIKAGIPRFMRYFVEQTERILRHRPLTKLEMHTDVGTIEFTLDQLSAIIDSLRREYAYEIDHPISFKSERDLQLTLHFEADEENEEENLD